MPHINTLVTDIQFLIRNKKNGWFTDELSADLGSTVSRTLKTQLGDERPAPRLRLSQMGPKCPCHLWHSIHKPELAQPLEPWAEIKFSFGHMIEALAITLAKASGHSVTGEQDELIVDGVRGHRDCVIDGAICDVKSCSSRTFQKIKAGGLALDDSFGYLDQLDSYIVGSAEDPLVTVKDRGYILAIHKELGHMCIYEHRSRPSRIIERIASYKEIVGRSTPPDCNCEVLPDGASGNIKLGVTASYSPFKYCCFPHLRCFLYSDGPRYLTKVVKRPKNSSGPITEVDKNGKVVYNF